MNRNSRVVLPIFSEQKTLVWVRSEHIDLQVVDTAEMQEAFDRCPYLTSEETANLAQRCSMHPDKVKVWFMAQRLYYGISWDCEDIHNVRKTLTPTGTRERKEGEEEEDVASKRLKKKRREKKSGGTEDKSKGRGVKKQNMWKVTDTVKKQRARKDENRLQIRKKKTSAAKHKDSFVVQLENRTSDTTSMADKLPELLKSMNLSTTSPHILETSDPEKKPKVEALLEGETADMNGDLDIADAPSTFAKEPKSGSCTPLIHSDTKSGNQVAMMRAAFLQCQYPNDEYYTELAEEIGIPRKFLVQWFCNMRYYIKTVKPRWMTKTQHRETVAKIKNRQDST